MNTLWVLCLLPPQPFRHKQHQRSEQQQICGVQADTYMGCQKAEHRGHEGGAQISAGHLDPDDGLGIFPAEVVGGGVNDGGIDRRTAETHDDQTCQSREIGRKREQNKCSACEGGQRPDADEQPVSEFVCHKTAEEAPEGDAQVKQGRKHGGCLCIDAAMLYQIAAGPDAGGGLQGTVGPKSDQHKGNALKP